MKTENLKKKRSKMGEKRVRCKVAEQTAGLLRLCCNSRMLLTTVIETLRVRWLLDVC